MNSYEKYTLAARENDSLLCVGLDTDIKKMPLHLRNDVKNMVAFNREIIEATKDLVNSYKINFAFYEHYGVEGMEILKKTIEFIPENILIIADAKRGDIGNTSLSYASSCFEYFGADAITVSPYMGSDSIEPFLQYKDKLVFILALTSNKGSADFQRLVMDGKPLYKHVIEKANTWAGYEQIGFVVGATHPVELEELRKDIPKNIILIPGVGAQGGDVEATLRSNAGGPAIINASRAVIYASDGKDFAEKAREQAELLVEQFRKK